MRMRRLVLAAVAGLGLAAGAACSGSGGSPTLADTGQMPVGAPRDTSGFVPPDPGVGH